MRAFGASLALVAPPVLIAVGVNVFMLVMEKLHPDTAARWATEPGWTIFLALGLSVTLFNLWTVFRVLWSGR